MILSSIITGPVSHPTIQANRKALKRLFCNSKFIFIIIFLRHHQNVMKYKDFKFVDDCFVKNISEEL